MKFSILRTGATPGAAPAQPWIVELPQSLSVALPAIGERFDVRLSKDGVLFEQVSACLLGDGRSLLVGNEVVRVGRRLVAARNSSYRVGLGAVPTQYSLQAKVLRPVEPKRGAATLGGGDLKSPMTGKVLAVRVENGTRVNEGDVLLTIEAMKMENRIQAECPGVIRNLKAAAGQSVNVGDLLLTLAPDQDSQAGS